MWVWERRNTGMPQPGPIQQIKNKITKTPSNKIQYKPAKLKKSKILTIKYTFIIVSSIERKTDRQLKAYRQRPEQYCSQQYRKSVRKGIRRVTFSVCFPRQVTSQSDQGSLSKTSQHYKALGNWFCAGMIGAGSSPHEQLVQGVNIRSGNLRASELL